MNKQRSNIDNSVRSILLIAIGIVLGVGISIGIGIIRIGNAPSLVSQRIGRFDRLVVLRDPGSRSLSVKVSGGRAVHVGRLNAAAVNRAAEVVRVNSNYVHYNSLLV